MCGNVCEMIFLNCQPNRIFAFLFFVYMYWIIYIGMVVVVCIP